MSALAMSQIEKHFITN